MLESFLFVIGGLVLLVIGGDRFVEGAAATARHLGIPPILIGLVVIGFATSAPELLVAATASLAGNPTVAMGNAIGSNIANIGLVLGFTAVVSPLFVSSGVLRREYPLMFVGLAIALLVCLDGALSNIDGVILAVSLIVGLTISGWMGLSSGTGEPISDEVEQHFDPLPSLPMSLLWVVIGFVVLLLGADLLVDGAVAIARAFGVPELVIGLTIVAVGTSLPELAASVAGALKGESELAIGNVIGSNMFNALGVLSVPALLAPGAVPVMLLQRDFTYMFVLSVALYFMAIGWRRPGCINRYEGAALVIAFCGYQGLLFMQGATT